MLEPQTYDCPGPVALRDGDSEPSTDVDTSVRLPQSLAAAVALAAPSRDLPPLNPLRASAGWSNHNGTVRAMKYSLSGAGRDVTAHPT